MENDGKNILAASMQEHSAKKIVSTLTDDISLFNEKNT